MHKQKNIFHISLIYSKQFGLALKMYNELKFKDIEDALSLTLFKNISLVRSRRNSMYVCFISMFISLNSSLFETPILIFLFFSVLGEAYTRGL